MHEYGMFVGVKCAILNISETADLLGCFSGLQRMIQKLLSEHTKLVKMGLSQIHCSIQMLMSEFSIIVWKGPFILPCIQSSGMLVVL